MGSPVLLTRSRPVSQRPLCFIPRTLPVLVKLLSPSAQEALRRHGCILEPFPRARPDILKGYMVTFPENTEMVQVAHICSSVFFPDGYQPLLVWEKGWYHLYLEEEKRILPRNTGSTVYKDEKVCCCYE